MIRLMEVLKRILGRLANSLFHHRPDATAQPKSKLEAAYHKADERSHGDGGRAPVNSARWWPFTDRGPDLCRESRMAVSGGASRHPSQPNIGVEPV